MACFQKDSLWFRNNFSEYSQSSSLCWHHHSNLLHPIYNFRYWDHHHKSYLHASQLVCTLDIHNPVKIFHCIMQKSNRKFIEIQYFAIVVPSTVIIKATSSTIPIAFGIVVLVITPLILRPTRGSTAFWWCNGGGCSCGCCGCCCCGSGCWKWRIKTCTFLKVVRHFYIFLKYK